MSKVQLLILFLFGTCDYCANTLDSLLMLGFGAETELESQSAFAIARNHVVNPKDEARLTYFKYFYHYRNDNIDSLEYYENRALIQLKQTESWTSYFTICNNRYFLIEDSGESEKAVIYAKEILKEASEVNDYRMMARMNARIGNSYHNISLFEKGVQHAKLGLDIAYQNIPEDEYTISQVLNVIAINFDDWGQADSAIFYHRKVILLQKLEEYDKRMAYNNIGNTFLKLNQLDSADVYISKALVLNQLKGDSYSLATSYNNKADVLLRKDNHQDSKILLDSALHYANKSGSMEKKRDVHDTWNRYYTAIGNSELALTHLKLFHAYKDSMVNVEKLQVIEKIELEELELAQKRALNMRNLWILIACTALVILLFLLRQMLQKRKRLEKEAVISLQEERLRISRDLHDNIGAELSYMSSLIDQKLFNEKDAFKRAELTELGSSSKSAMHQLRETIWAIQTDEITLQKFKEKLEQLSRRYSENLNIDVKVSFTGEDHLLNPVQAINIFRICQEALNNSFKHAKDQSVNIRIEGRDSEIKVSVSDSGIGFDLQETTSGYGLHNMNERAEQLGGTLKIESEMKIGTSVILNVPT